MKLRHQRESRHETPIGSVVLRNLPLSHRYNRSSVTLQGVYYKRRGGLLLAESILSEEPRLTVEEGLLETSWKLRSADAEKDSGANGPGRRKGGPSRRLHSSAAPSKNHSESQ